MSKELLSQGPVPALHDALVQVDVNTSTSDLDPVFGEQLVHCSLDSPASSPPSYTPTGQQCPNWQCFKVVSAVVSGAKYMP